MISKIWIDADSCPSLIRDYIVNYGIRTNTEVFFVANQKISAKKDSFKMIICEKEKDAADNYIFSMAEQSVQQTQVPNQTPIAQSQTYVPASEPVVSTPVKTESEEMQQSFFDMNEVSSQDDNQSQESGQFDIF